MENQLPIISQNEELRDRSRIDTLEENMAYLRELIEQNYAPDDDEYGDDSTYIDPLVKQMLKRLDETSASIQALEKVRTQIIDENNQLRGLVYVNWTPNMCPIYKITNEKKLVISRYAKFESTNPQTYPPVLQDSQYVLQLIDGLNKGLGHALRIVMEMRYPETYRRVQPIQPFQKEVESAPAQQAPVMVSAPPQAVDQARVRSAFTGFFEIRLAQIENEFKMKELEARNRLQNRPQILSNNVIDDPVDRINQLPSVINEMKDFFTNCIDTWTFRRNEWYATLVHNAMRKRTTKLLTAIESFVHAQTDLDIKEAYDKITALSSHFTRIIEANAMQPTTIQQFTKPYQEGGFSDDLVESRKRRNKSRG